MKILHTADWHIGRTLNQLPLLDTQAQVLRWFTEVVKNTQPDVAIIAGDIYDRSVAPAEAVKLFSDTVDMLVKQLGIPLMAIAGNHDNPDRIDYGASLLAGQQFFVCGTISYPLQPVVLHDEHGPVYFYLCPYTEPDMLRFVLSPHQSEETLQSIQTHQDVFHWISTQIKTQRQAGDRVVVVAHAFVQGAEESESERRLMVGGAEHVHSSTFEAFSYTALGHLHKPQSFAGGRVRYAGSPLKYSISEVHHRKSVSLVHLEAEGQLSIEEIPVQSPRDLCIVKGEIRQGEFVPDDDENQASPDDFVYIKLHNRELQTNPMSTIRQRYPYAIGMEWITAPFQSEGIQLKAHEVHAMSETDLFARFYEEFTQSPLDEAKLRIIEEVIQEIQQL